MSVRARRPAPDAVPATTPEGVEVALPPAPPRRPGRRLPALPLIAGAAGIALLATAWTTRWTPGPARTSAEAETHLTLELSPDQQRVINSWQRFFICYDLAYENVIDPTLRANLRANGSLQFPGDKVEVELPAANAHPTAAEGGSEDELIQVRQSVLDALSRDATGARQQCAGGVPVPTAPAPAPTPAPSVNGPAAPSAVGNRTAAQPTDTPPVRTAPARTRAAPARTPPARTP